MTKYLCFTSLPPRRAHGRPETGQRPPAQGRDQLHQHCDLHVAQIIKAAGVGCNQGTGTKHRWRPPASAPRQPRWQLTLSSTPALKHHHTGQTTGTCLWAVGEDSWETATPEEGAAGCESHGPLSGHGSPCSAELGSKQSTAGGARTGTCREGTGEKPHRDGPQAKGPRVLG